MLTASQIKKGQQSLLSLPKTVFNQFIKSII